MSADSENAMPTVADFVGKHLTWVLSLFPFVVAGIRLVVVYRGDQEVLRYLVQDLSIVALLMATVVPLIPVGLFWLYVLALEWYFSTPKEQRGISATGRVIAPIFGALFVAAIIFMPIGLLIANVGLLAIFLLSDRLIRWRARKVSYPTPETEIRENVLRALVCVATGAVIISSSMWLPVEVVKLRDSKPQVGYVLSIKDDWTTFLDRDHAIHIFRTTDTESRQACGPISLHYRPIISIHKTTNTRCPD